MRTLEPRYSKAACVSRSVGAFAVVLFLTSATSHRLGILETVPFFWLLGLVFLIAIAGFCLAIMGVVQFWEHGLYGLKSALLGALLSALALVPYGVSAYRFAVHPRLTDISTDISRPPQLVQARALRVPPMNPLRPASEKDRLLQVGAYPDLAGRRYEHAGEQVLTAVRRLLDDRGWELLTPLPEGEEFASVTIEAVAHSFLLGLPADVAIRVEERLNGTYVDMRSVSRYGRHDLGENATRIRRFLEELDRRLEGESL